MKELGIVTIKWQRLRISRIMLMDLWFEPILGIVSQKRTIIRFRAQMFQLFSVVCHTVFSRTWKGISNGYINYHRMYVGSHKFKAPEKK